MNENTLEGGVKTGVGKLEGAAGDVLGDRELQARGGATQLEGRVQDAVGSAQRTAAQVTDQAREAVYKASGQVKDVYGRVTDRAQAIGDTVDPFVREQPYAALGLAAATGLLVGLLLAGRGPKIVYVEPRG